MAEIQISIDELLSGATISHSIKVPKEIISPGSAASSPDLSGEDEWVITLKPITIGSFQLIMKATKNDPGLIPLFMIKESLVEPKLSLDQIKQMHLGLIGFLVEQIREISGISQKKTSSSPI